MEGKLNVLATHQCQKTDDLYLLVDFLNRNLKDKDIIFGLSKSDEPDKMQITLYRTDIE
ncbi:YpmA family protein [Alicyclobacillus acidiphilus]|uniref:YpmA family protein n=1 Tax=Alicyclobacillus acidiphilus TaxID=182455 RepID=UPI0009FB18C5|nr:YpmA family protein [Alicyclobacillus acidiphilus]